MEIPQVQAINKACWRAVQDRFDQLIKPVGSLARIEEITCLYAAAQDLSDITLPDNALLLAFGGCGAERDAGAESAYEFFAGYDALNGLADILGAVIIPIRPAEDLGKAEGTPLSGAAMSREAFAAAFRRGQDAARMAAARGVRVVGLGCRYGQKSAVRQSALCRLMLAAEMEERFPKEERILLDEILGQHAHLDKNDSIGLMRAVGGFELPALLGAILQAANQGMPVFLDGTATLIAALAAVKLRPAVKDYLIAVSTTTEPWQSILLTQLELSTMLDLKLQTPSGEGALFGFNLLAAGIKALNEMDSFGKVHSPLGDLSK